MEKCIAVMFGSFLPGETHHTCALHRERARDGLHGVNVRRVLPQQPCPTDAFATTDFRGQGVQSPDRHAHLGNCRLLGRLRTVLEFATFLLHRHPNRLVKLPMNLLFCLFVDSLVNLFLQGPVVNRFFPVAARFGVCVSGTLISVSWTPSRLFEAVEQKKRAIDLHHRVSIGIADFLTNITAMLEQLCRAHKTLEDTVSQIHQLVPRGRRKRAMHLRAFVLRVPAG